MPPLRPVRASVPGKVLIAGGYVVLDPAYEGLVLAVSARFQTRVAPSILLSPSPSPSNPSPSLPPPVTVGSTERIVRVHVRSPQFTDGTWDYDVYGASEPPVVHLVELAGRENPFVAAAIRIVVLANLHRHGLAELKRRFGQGNGPRGSSLSAIQITCTADNAFYSQASAVEGLPREAVAPALRDMAPQAPLGLPMAEVPKTGLGSSAVLVTSLVAALAAYLLQAPAERDAVHRLAQLAHCLAQGKIGSGFDVAAACYGACLYRRWSPSPLADALAGWDALTAPSCFAQATHPAAWTHVATPLCMPRCLHLVLADVVHGADTRHMVRGVLAWRAAHPQDAAQLWQQLDAYNRAFGACLARLASLEAARAGDPQWPKDVDAAAASRYAPSAAPAAPLVPADPSVNAVAAAMTVNMAGIRLLWAELGQRSGVAVEPPAQTALLDHLQRTVPGLVAAGVPGAGGGDAIFGLVLGEAARDALDAALAAYPQLVIRLPVDVDARAGLGETDVGAGTAPAAMSEPAGGLCQTIEPLQEL
ncbi:hypothetical protein CXG81DRAFT_28553 [Caulochytrium protostelioides]|uniref:Phosphomevalonate kinase n=1 Tax=Caulochytrium protostelioides TaxID=1555241 RepID=A0A4P9WV93_9FUNG|nr:Phosphomevalonate kinase [Caulochytrium protostelioides]RKO98641.1 hypothetical protein CXG81DRAFT_28553 [Caulochytrium protostelioides]|eukprot:RKO98641.1 hypothetical protein CXG81DRAFT_28553 [Caulochytrium protostelioides]